MAAGSMAMPDEQSDNTCDTSTLRKIPEEVWMMIFDYVTAPQDFENASNSSPFFRHLLKPRRTQFLFPKVWNMLGPLLHEKYSETYDYHNLELYQDPADPQYWDHDRYCISCLKPEGAQWYSGILQLRSVCANWRRVIDQHYQRISFHHKDHPTAKDKYTEWTEDTFQHQHRNIPRFLHYMEQAPSSAGCRRRRRNPFLSRTVQFIVHNLNDADYRQYSRDICSLLSKFGRHIHRCTLYFNHIPDVGDIVQWVGFLRNVHRLQIEISSRFPTGLTPEQERTQMSSVLRLSPFPTLKKLKIVTVKGCHAPLVDNLVVRNNHVSVLDVTGCLGKEDLYRDMYTVPKFNLTILDIWYQSGAELEKLRNLHVGPAFRKLSLHLYRLNISPFYVFSLLGSTPWAGSLTHFTLHMVGGGAQMGLKGGMEQETRSMCHYLKNQYLPRVTHFKLYLFG